MAGFTARSDSLIERRDESYRRAVVRMLLGLGALTFLALIATLPLANLTGDELGSLLALAALLTLTMCSLTGLKKFPRASIGSMMIASVYCAFALARVAPWMHLIHIMEGRGPAPGVFFSYLIASIGSYTIPIALIVAWPLRNAR